VTALATRDLPFQKFAGKFRNVPAGSSGRSAFQKVSAICQIIPRVHHQTQQYRPINAVVEHKGLLRGGGCFPNNYLPSSALTSCTIRGRSCTFVHVSVTRSGDDAVQSVKPKRGKTRCRGIRLDELLIGRVERAAKEGGFSNPSAFIRAAIQRELTGRENEVEASEERIAASLDRLGREIRSVKLAQQALFAFVDSLVKTLLTCIAEPPSDARDQAVAQGKFRYDRFLKSVDAAMAGDSKAAMAELLNRADES
jgi:Arc/MetJ-type ribon-helix-helix transcriptional regulator